MSSTAIADHALLSDRHSSAWSTRPARSTGWPFPASTARRCSAGCSATEAGHWQIAAGRRVDEHPPLRRPDAGAGDDVHHAETATLVLTDALAIGPGQRRAPARRRRPAPAGPPAGVHRRRGRGGGRLRAAPGVRPGRAAARRRRRRRHRARRRRVAGADHTGRRWTCDRGTASRHGSRLERGRDRCTSRCTARRWSRRRRASGRRTSSPRRLDDTVGGVAVVVGRCTRRTTGRGRDLVHHSGRVLQGLSFQPSGAIVAAATTSLPEGVGGERNWDYRYSWVRDASFTMEALWVAACPDEADDFFAFMTTAAASSVGPGHGPADHVRRRRRARPDRARAAAPARAGGTAARCGSATARGTSARSTSTASCSAPRSGSPTSSARSTTTPGGSWSPAPTPPPTAGREKDQGIWEVRGEPQHFLYSKVMCWVALDRAIALADLLGAADRVDRWKQHARRDLGAPSSATAGASEAGAFTQSSARPPWTPRT